MRKFAARTTLHPLATALALVFPTLQLSAQTPPHLHPLASSNGPSLQLAPTVRTVTVSNCNDSGAGSLRAAYETALDGDTIDLSTLKCSVITLSSELKSPTTANSVTVTGAFAGTIGGIVIDAANKGRAFHHQGTGILGLNNVTVKNGSYVTADVARGGCIFANVAAQVSLSNSVVTNCSAKSLNSSLARGGAIYAGRVVAFESRIADSTVYSNANYTQSGLVQGGGIWSSSLLLARSTVSGNTASSGSTYSIYSGGGGVFAKSPDVYQSTISGNTAGVGAGIYRADNGGTPLIHSSTISGNKALGFGAAAYVQGSVSVIGSTVAKNVSTGGGAFFGNTVNVRSSIFADNTQIVQGTPTDLQVRTSLVGDHNLIMHFQGNFGIVTPADTIVDDPLLGTLQINGGPTATHALLPGSPAIDHGSNPLALGFDQRGSPYQRAAFGVPDIGAFEVSDLIFDSGFER